MRCHSRPVTSLTSETRPSTGWHRTLWVSWATWAAIVLSWYFGQLWRTAQQPSVLWALAAGGLYETLKCLVIGGAALLAILAAVRAWRALQHAVGVRAVPLTLLAIGPCAYPWFVARHQFETALSAIRTGAFPALGEAIARGGSGVIGAFLVALAALLLGRGVLAAFRLTDASGIERLLMALGFGFGALSYVSLALAAADIYHPTSVALLLTLIIIGAAIAAWVSPPRARVSANETPQASKPSYGRLEAAWLAIAFVACCFALVAAFAPETEYDALWYHLYLPRLWLEAGHTVDVVQEFPSLYPLTWELVFGAGLVVGGTIAAKLLHACCLAIITITLLAAGRRYASSSTALVAIGLLLTTPTVLWEAGTAYVDLALAMYVCLGSYALARFLETSNRAWLIAAGLQFGFGAATKHLGLIALGIAAGILMWALWQRTRSARAIISAAAVLVIIGVAIPVPWYVRSCYASGNPFFPELYALFGGGPPTRWDAANERGLAAFKAHFGVHQGIVSLLRLPWDVTVHSAFFGGALGPLWLLLVPLAFTRRARLRNRGVIAVATLAYVAVWASPISSDQMRFLIPVLAGLALLGAEGWRAIMEASATSRYLRIATAVLLLGVAFLNLPPWMAVHEADRHATTGWLTHVLRASPTGVVTGRESEDRYLARTLPSYAAWQYANSHLPADAVVLTFIGGDHLYSRRARIPYDSVLARSAVWTAKGEADVSRALQRLGVRYVLFDKRVLPQLEAQGLPIAGAGVQRACVTLYQDSRVRLCQFGVFSGGVSASPFTARGETRDQLTVLRNACVSNPRGDRTSNRIASAAIRCQARRSRTRFRMRSASWSP